MEQVYRFFEAYPTLGGMLITLVVWPTLTGLISFAQDELARRYPRVWDVVQRSGFDALGLIRARWPRRLPPPPSGPRPPSAPPPLPPLTLMVGLLLVVGCGSPLGAAVEVPRAGAEAIEHGGEELGERCTEPLRAAAELPTLEERRAAAAPIREVCDPARMAYGSARASHVLLSATLGALAGGVTVGELLDLTAQTARALGELARSFALLRGAR